MSCWRRSGDLEGGGPLLLLSLPSCDAEEGRMVWEEEDDYGPLHTCMRRRWAVCMQWGLQVCLCGRSRGELPSCLWCDGGYL